MIQRKPQPLRALIFIAYTNGTFENKTGSTRSTAIPLSPVLFPRIRRSILVVSYAE
jgi:hypothetical protein